MEEVLDSRLEGLPEASVVKLPRERLNRVNVVCMMMMESLTFELVFFPPVCLNFRLMALSNELSEVMYSKLSHLW